MAAFMASIIYLKLKYKISKTATIENPRNIEVTLPIVPGNVKGNKNVKLQQKFKKKYYSNKNC